MLFDTHSHLYDKAFALGENPESEFAGSCEAVKRAVGAGVGKIILPACEYSELEKIERLRKEFPEHIFMAAGIHPENLPAADLVPQALDRMKEYLETHRSHLVAVGEIGIDLYWDKTRLKEQKEVFRFQCLTALDLDLPVIIHCREGLDEVLEVFGTLPRIPRGVFHCFAGTADDVAKIRKAGDFYFGIGGIVTFKKSTLPQTIPAIPRDRILLETDSPYMAPVPMRGKRNESAYLPYIAEKMAEILGLTPGETARLTTENALRLFGC